MQKDVGIAMWRAEGQFSLEFGDLLRILLPADVVQNLKLLRLHKGELLIGLYREIFDLQSIFLFHISKQKYFI